MCSQFFGIIINFLRAPPKKGQQSNPINILWCKFLTFLKLTASATFNWTIIPVLTISQFCTKQLKPATIRNPISELSYVFLGTFQLRKDVRSNGLYERWRHFCCYSHGRREPNFIVSMWLHSFLDGWLANNKVDDLNRILPLCHPYYRK